MKKIVMLSVPPASGVDVIGPLEALGIASRMVAESSGRPAYESELVTSASDLALPTSSGVKIVAHKHYTEVRGKVDTLLISGGPGTRGPRDPALLEWLRQMAKHTRRICSICTGAYLLADDDLEGGHALHGLGAVHLVVVGDGDAVDALGQAGLDEMLGLEQRVVAVPGVAVQVQAQSFHQSGCSMPQRRSRETAAE